MYGKVTLVGAGPGDPGLLTMKGRRAIEQAEVVVYDRLVSPRILALIPEGAEKIDVGKEAAHHKVPQEQINQILLEKGLAGKNVVRLKGGDPFVFGRGGEELELLLEHGVEFEEIPGISSSIAAAAYAGIPVTHRDFTSSLHIITGHARAGASLTIDFDALVRTRGTLVFLMGVTAMPQIMQGLLDAGMDADMPAAMVENGTLPYQRRCIATVGTLPQAAKAMGIHSPAVIIVGKVCSLSDDFCWLEKLPLAGRRILVTRPKERLGSLRDRLSRLGADVWEYPCIEIQPITPCPGMEQALENLQDYRTLVFTSPAGVECFWKCLRDLNKDARALGHIHLAVIGTGTAKALEEHGLCADFIPSVYDARHLGQELPTDGPVLILRAQIGSAELTEALDRRGIAYTDIAVYETVFHNPEAERAAQAIAQNESVWVTFTSASTVRGFAASLPPRTDLSHVLGFCIGEQTAAEARRYGITPVIAAKATMDALTDSIIAYNRTQSVPK